MRLRSIAVPALAVLLAACGNNTPLSNEGGQPVRNVVVRLVKPQQLDVKIKLPVVVEPKDTLELRAAASGRITSLPYDKGDVIPATSVPKSGWLDVDEYLSKRPEGSPEPTGDEIIFRNLDYLDGFKCFARIDDSQLRQNFREAQANYDQAVRDLRRTEDYPQSTGAQLDAARTRVNVGRAAVERVRAMIEDTYICNPKQGVLTDRMHQAGEYVNMGELIGKVAVMDRLVAKLELPEADRQSVEIGETMGVELDSVKDEAGQPLKRDATVTRIDAVADSTTHSFTVELEIPNADLKLPAGIFGTTEVTIYSKPDALVVPLTAVRLSGESKSLFVIPASGGKQVRELTGIELGQLTAKWVEIRGDKLKPGMRVVTVGAQSLGDGDQVNWTEKDPYVVQGTEEAKS